MPETPKTLHGLSLALLASTSLVTAALLTAPVSARAQAAATAAVQLAAGQSGSADTASGSADANNSGDVVSGGAPAGGGEGGESGSQTSTTPVTDDVAYLTQLGLLRAHLDVGMELYRIGQQAAAEAQIKPLENSLYKPLEPALKARAAPDIEPALEKLANGIEKKAPTDEVEDAHAAVLTAISEAEAVANTPSPHEIGEIITALIRHAAKEYGEAVKDGKIVKAAPYQEALGCLRVAEDWHNDLSAMSDNATAVAAIRAQLDLIGPAWPAVVPPAKAPRDPSVIFGAAARIEIAALKLKQ